MIKHKTLHMILQIEIPKGQPESVEQKDRQCKGQKDRQCNGQKDRQYNGQKDRQYNDQKDKQLSTKHYAEN